MDAFSRRWRRILPAVTQGKAVLARRPATVALRVARPSAADGVHLPKNYGAWWCLEIGGLLLLADGRRRRNIGRDLGQLPPHGAATLGLERRQNKT